MTNSTSVRLVGLVSVPAAVLLAFLTPVQAKAFDDEVRPWLRDLDTVHSFADEIWSTLGGSLDRYEFWGRWTVICYLGMIVGLWAFARATAPSSRGPWLLLGALWLAAVGDVGAYWGQDWELGSQIFGSVEFFALPFVFAGTVLYGWVLVRHGPLPRWVGWILLASAAVVPVSMGLTNYWPHGALLPISVGIAVVSVVSATRHESAGPTRLS